MRTISRRPSAIVSLAFVVGCQDETPVGPPLTDAAAATSSAPTPDLEPPLSLTVVDPAGDHTGPIDVVRMEMGFDDGTGDYEISLTASAAAPFDGDFRVNINLFNVDANSFFQDVVNDFTLASPTPTLVLAGTSSVLTSWGQGDRVHTNSLGGTPNPPGVSLFRSAVSTPPSGFLTNEDFIAFLDETVPAVIELSDEPEPPPPACGLIDQVTDLLDQFVAEGKIAVADAAALQASLDTSCKALVNGRKRRTYRFLQQFLSDLRSLWDEGGIAASHSEAEILRDAAAEAMRVLRGEV